jgi:hypothetical protein
MRPVAQPEITMQRAGGFGHVVNVIGAAGHMLMGGIMLARPVRAAGDLGLAAGRVRAHDQASTISPGGV